ncbi:MAG: hypothetical protein KAH57_10880 [Thermoplasmata archaeon]|nr:hypothetical protein [Thermoplasmata archaeon]
MSEDELNMAKGRLAKLWDAYEALDKENKYTLASIKELNDKAREKDRIVLTLRELIESRDTDNRKLDIQRSSLQNQVEDLKIRYEDQLSDLEKERSRYRKLYRITEDLEIEVDSLRKGVEERDQWFKSNLMPLSEIPTLLELRQKMIGRFSSISSTNYELERIRPGSEKVEETPVKEIEPEETTFERVDDKAEALKSLQELPGINEVKAKALMEAGYGSLEKLKDVSPFELVKLQGITPTIARKISEFVKV